MLRRIPNRITWRHIRCLQSLTTPAALETSSGVTSAAGVQHASTVQPVYHAGGGHSSRTWQAWPVMAGVAAAAAAWHVHGNSIALADAARPDKVTHSSPAVLLTRHCPCMNMQCYQFEKSLHCHTHEGAGQLPVIVPAHMSHVNLLQYAQNHTMVH
jgi:hypothetical protein